MQESSSLIEQYGIILAALIPVFATMAAGFVLRRTGRLKAEADESLMRVVVTVLYPCLTFSFVLGNEALANPANLLLPPLVGAGTILAGFALAFLVGPLVGLRLGTGRRTFAFGVGIYNFGYLPIPLVTVLFGQETLGVLAVHNVGVEIALWTAGIILVSGAFNKKAFRRILNPPLIALVLAMTLNLSGLAATLPSFVIDTARFAGFASMPLGIMLAGATLADEVRATSPLQPWPVPLGAVTLRLIALPLLFLWLAISLPGATTELRHVIIVQAAMPAGLFPIVLARHFGGHPATAVKVVVATTVVSLFTIPLWIALGLRFVG